MNEKEIKETKAIKVLFQKLLNDSYKQKEYREIYTIDILPRTVKNIEKYSDFEKNILNKNSYNVLNKFILALSKLYLYDNKIFKLSHDDEESLSFQEYHKVPEHICVQLLLVVQAAMTPNRFRTCFGSYPILHMI